MFDPEKIMERILIFAGASTIPELADKWNMPQSTLYNWRDKGSIKIDKLLQKAGNANLNWLITGEGSMLKDVHQGKSEGAHTSEDVLRAEADKIQFLIDQGMLKIPTAGTLTAIKTVGEGCCASDECYDVPIYSHHIAAGQPTDSTCQAEKIALPAILVKHPEETYAVTVSGDSMTGAGIEEGDILIVDRAIEPANKSIVIASINGEQTVKRLFVKKGEVSLMPENHKYPEIPITKEMDFRTLGVVTWVIRRTS